MGRREPPVATKLVFDSIEENEATGSAAGTPRPVETPLAADLSHEPEHKPYPGYVRVGILIGGALACWAVVAGVMAAL